MICRFAKLLISHAADSDRQPGRVTQWHIRRCADCRRFHLTCQRLAHALQTEAVHLRPYRGRVAREVVDRLDSERPVGRSVPLRAVLAAAACVAILIGSLALWPQRQSRDPGTDLPVPTVGANPAAVVTRILENTLAAEVRHLTRDTESGLRFLVVCLDARPAAEAVHPESILTSPPSVQ